MVFSFWEDYGKYGERQHLVFLDNNILASDNFSDIIKDIVSNGFEAGSMRNARMRTVDFNQGLDAREDVCPAQMVDCQERGQHQPEREYDELDVVGQNDRDHAAEAGIDQHQREQENHHGRQCPARGGESGDPDDELGTDLQEQSHVEDAAQRHRDATQDSRSAAETPLVEFGDRHYPHLPQSVDEEAGGPHRKSHQSGGQGNVKGGESALEALLCAVHDRDQSQLGPRQCGDSQASSQ